MIVDAWYVPNTPTLIVQPDWDLPAFPFRPVTRAALERAGATTRSRNPDTIVVVSPHFQARRLLPVVVAERPAQIYDFEGFPAHFYGVRYEPPGDPNLADAIVAEGQAAGLPVTRVVSEWGLDHGAWAPLCRMFPDAALPVVPVGLGAGVPDADHEALGAAIARASGTRRVAVVATGSLLHRLDLWDGEERPLEPARAAALRAAEAALTSGRWEALWSLPAEVWKELAPEGGVRPLRVLAGAVGNAYAATLLSSEHEYGAASLSVVHIDPLGRAEA